MTDKKYMPEEQSRTDIIPDNTSTGIFEVIGRETYFAVGKEINPCDLGLEGRVGPGEAVVEIPKELLESFLKARKRDNK